MFNAGMVLALSRNRPEFVDLLLSNGADLSEVGLVEIFIPALRFNLSNYYLSLSIFLSFVYLYICTIHLCTYT